MLKRRAPLKVLEIGKIRIGGTPENPPVMIGTIFYHQHKIIKEPKKGFFDREEAEKLVKLQEELSDKTGIPSLVDVAGETVEALTKYVDFIADITVKPFLIDILSRSFLEAIVKHVSEIGLKNRIIINSVTPKSSSHEFKVLKNYKIKSVIALLYVSQIADIKARLAALKELVSKLEVAGITVPLVDTFVIDPPSLIAATRTIVEIKSTMGFPSGCGAHNAASQLRKAYKQKFGKEGYKAVEITYNMLPLLFGADFILYGPIEACKYAIPAAYGIFTSFKAARKYIKTEEQRGFLVM